MPEDGCVIFHTLVCFHGHYTECNRKELVSPDSTCDWAKHSDFRTCYTSRLLFLSLFFKDFIHLLLERREGREKGREKERERNINVWLPLEHPLLEAWPIIQARALTEN